MNRKTIFLQGILLIAITMVANVILSNWMFSRRIQEGQARQDALIRSIDHIFTALTYMERNSGSEFNEKIKNELESARKTLRTPELITIRRELEMK